MKYLSVILAIVATAASTIVHSGVEVGTGLRTAATATLSVLAVVGTLFQGVGVVSTSPTLKNGATGPETLK